jgi:hypothetical protein
MPISEANWVLDPANRADAMQFLIDRLQLAPDFAAKSYELAVATLDGLAKDAKFDPEGFRNALQLRAEFEGDWGATRPPIERYFNPTYYDKALTRFQ